MKATAMPCRIDMLGWCNAAQVTASSNCDARPPDTAIDLLVLHCISLPPGQYGGDGVMQLFTNALDWDAHPFYRQIRGLRVSAHFFIDRLGHLFQFVSCDQRAWHAGVSSFQGRDRCNDFSIGIELEGTDDTPYESDQYRSLARLVEALTERYPITTVAGHSDIAPTRKTDPGAGFDWERFMIDTSRRLRRAS